MPHATVDAKECQMLYKMVLSETLKDIRSITEHFDSQRLRIDTVNRIALAVLAFASRKILTRDEALNLLDALDELRLCEDGFYWTIFSHSFKKYFDDYQKKIVEEHHVPSIPSIPKNITSHGMLRAMLLPMPPNESKRRKPRIHVIPHNEVPNTPE